MKGMGRGQAIDCVKTSTNPSPPHQIRSESRALKTKPRIQIIIPFFGIGFGRGWAKVFQAHHFWPADPAAFKLLQQLISLLRKHPNPPPFHLALMISPSALIISVILLCYDKYAP